MQDRVNATPATQRRVPMRLHCASGTLKPADLRIPGGFKLSYKLL
jgi:hypothetical protein